MTVSQSSPSVDGAISKINQRLDRLERRLRIQPDQFRPTVDYSYSGPVTTAGSPNYSFEVPEVAYSLVLHLTTAGSTATVVELRKNGVTVDGGTATLGADVDKVTVPLSVLYGGQDQDVLRLVTTTAGTGAVDLTVIVRLRLADAKPIA